MGVTEELARFVTNARYRDLPGDLTWHARRCVLDSLGVALGAVGHPSVAILLDFVREVGGNPQATVLGCGLKTSVLNAALVNGHLPHVLDYDDTYMPPETILHGTAPLLPPILALAEWKRLPGWRMLEALILGFEAEARISLAMGRAHLEAGWHVTATVGTFGAAVAAGKLLDLDARSMAYALGIAGTLASGVTEMLGTMCKPLHPGKTAMHGLMAAMLAARGFDSSPRVLESPKGFGTVLAGDRNFDAVTDALGDRWELRRNGFKPYASGVVTHPIIDGAIELRNRHGLQPEDVEAVDARTNPFVLVPTGKTEPRTGLEGKFSIYHCVAIALIEGAAGEAQFTDEKVNEARAIDLRRRVRILPEEAIRKDEAYVSILLRDGRRLETHVEHASGTEDNPMSDEAMRQKFLHLSAPVLGEARARRAIELVDRLEALADGGDLVRACDGMTVTGL